MQASVLFVFMSCVVLAASRRLAVSRRHSPSVEEMGATTADTAYPDNMKRQTYAQPSSQDADIRCAKGHYIQKVIAHENSNCFCGVFTCGWCGTVDIEIECTNGEKKKSAQVTNAPTDKDEALECKDGFSKLEVHEQHGHGVVNFRGTCSSSSGQSLSNGYNGQQPGWKSQNPCHSGKVLVGLTTWSEANYGIVDLQTWCDEPMQPRQCTMSLQLLWKGWSDHELHYEEGASSSSGTYDSHTRNTLNAKLTFDLKKSVNKTGFEQGGSVEWQHDMNNWFHSARRSASSHRLKQETYDFKAQSPGKMYYIYQPVLTVTMDNGEIVMARGGPQQVSEQLDSAGVACLE